jgi:transporter family protein
MIWLVYAILSAFTDSCSKICDKIAVKHVDPALSATLYFTIEASILLIFNFLIKKNHNTSVSSLNLYHFFFIVLAGLVGGLSWIFYFNALKHGPLSKVIITDYIGLLFTTSLGVVILGETVGTQQVIGAALITFGAMLVAFS